MATILIVDDEHLTLEMLSTYLRLIGHEPLEALNAKQTWDRLAYQQPDAILLDIMLPDTDGLEICRQLREKPETRDIPVIMISAWTPPKLQEADKVGANGYLIKPIKIPDLQAALAKVGIG